MPRRHFFTISGRGLTRSGGKMRAVGVRVEIVILPWTDHDAQEPAKEAPRLQTGLSRDLQSLHRRKRKWTLLVWQGDQCRERQHFVVRRFLR